MNVFDPSLWHHLSLSFHSGLFISGLYEGVIIWHYLLLLWHKHFTQRKILQLKILHVNQDQEILICAITSIWKFNGCAVSQQDSYKKVNLPSFGQSVVGCVDRERKLRWRQCHWLLSSLLSRWLWRQLYWRKTSWNFRSLLSPVTSTRE